MRVIALALAGALHIGATEQSQSGYVRPEDSALEQAFATLLLAISPDVAKTQEKSTGFARTAQSQMKAGAEAKLRWLEKLDGLKLGRQTNDALYKVPLQAEKDSPKQQANQLLTQIVDKECEAGDDEACSALNADEKAKFDWFAKQVLTNIVTTKEARVARFPWLRNRERANQAVTEESHSGDDEARNVLNAEEEAKKHYLAARFGRLRNRGQANQASSNIESRSGDDEALSNLEIMRTEPRRANLEIFDIGTGTEESQSGHDEARNALNAEVGTKHHWFERFGRLRNQGKDNQVLTKIATEACESGDDEACNAVNAEEEAKFETLGPDVFNVAVATEGRRNDMLARLGVVGKNRRAVPGPHYTMGGQTRSKQRRR